jgi:ADP-ribosylglycohydrolase
MIGAIAGDIIGSVYEFRNWKGEKDEFPLFSERSKFTDDTVLSVATADCIMHDLDFTETYQKYARMFRNAGYGGMFKKWIDFSDPQPYNSFGNGSAMRISPIGFAYDTLEKTLEMAKKSAEVTHNHPEGIKGAQAIASAIFLARTGKDKEQIKFYIEETFEYDLDTTVAARKPDYWFQETCQGSVPEAIRCFLESKNYEDCIRLTIWLGGDCDTTGCMAGGIAQAYYGMPKLISTEAYKRLDPKLLEIVKEFENWMPSNKYLQY